MKNITVAWSPLHAQACVYNVKGDIFKKNNFFTKKSKFILHTILHIQSIRTVALYLFIFIKYFAVIELNNINNKTYFKK